MKVELLPSTVGQTGTRQFCMSVIVNDSVAVDAGTLGLLLPMSRQKQIRHVFLSHSHIDHIGTLPLFLDNVYTKGPDCPGVYACTSTADSLRKDIFNNRVWPDFFRLSEEESPFLKLHIIESEVPVDPGPVTVIPVALNHNVPTMGFVLKDSSGAVGFVSDTSPTSRIWEILSEMDDLRAIFLECSFPNSLRWLADQAFHLCPELFDRELKKLRQDIPVFVYHIKPSCFDEVEQELVALGRSNVEIAVPGQPYTF